MTVKKDPGYSIADASQERIDDKRRAALAKLGKLGITSAAASVAVLAMTRKAAASP